MHASPSARSASLLTRSALLLDRSTLLPARSALPLTRFAAPVLLALAALHTAAAAQPPARPTGASELVELTDGWRMTAGDDLAWVAPDIETSSWTEVATTADLERAARRRWLRRSWSPPESFRGREIGVSVELQGSLQLFVDSRLVASLGALPEPAGAGRPARGRFFRLQLPDAQRVTLTARYQDATPDGFDWLDAGAGFRILAGPPEALVERARTRARLIGGHQWMFVGLFAGQALLHTLLFLFWRAIRSNLYFAITAACSALLVGLQFERALSDDAQVLALSFRLWGPILFAAILSVLLFIYELFDHPRGIPFWTLGAVGTASTLVVALRTDIDAFVNFGWFHLAVILEAARVTVLAMRRGWRGAWILGVGTIFLLAGLVWQFLLLVGAIAAPKAFFPISYYGVAAFFFSGSVYLAFRFAELGKDLREQLDQVEALSAQTLRQELEAKEREIEQRVLEAEHDRKSDELEEARALQRSMLPADLPELEHVEIAAAMSTASEVAGDYYDVSVSDTGAVAVVLADVAGHGARAGAMVSLVKGMFSALSPHRDARLFLRESSETLRSMRLRGVHIALVVGRLRGNSWTVTSAAMPPVYVLRSDTGEVEEMASESLPLGAALTSRYTNRSLPVAPGDTILLLSDGLPELPDAKGDALGYRRVRRCVAECHGKSPRQVVEHLQRVARSWSGGPPFPDDLTFVVLRLRDQPAPGEETTETAAHA